MFYVVKTLENSWAYLDRSRALEHFNKVIAETGVKYIEDGNEDTFIATPLNINQRFLICGEVYAKDYTVSLKEIQHDLPLNVIMK